MILDMMGLTDPFIAHLPLVAGAHWKPGHGVRYVRRDYIRTRLFEENLIEDPAEAQLLDWIDSRHRGGKKVQYPTPDQWAAIQQRNKLFEQSVADLMSEDTQRLFVRGDFALRRGLAPLVVTSQFTNGISVLFKSPVKADECFIIIAPRQQVRVSFWRMNEGLPRKVEDRLLNLDAMGRAKMVNLQSIGSFDELRLDPQTSGEWRLDTLRVTPLDASDSHSTGSSQERRR